MVAGAAKMNEGFEGLLAGRSLPSEAPRFDDARL